LLPFGKVSIFVGKKKTNWKKRLGRSPLFRRLAMAVQKPFVSRDLLGADAWRRLITRHPLVMFLGVRVGAFLLLAVLVSIAQKFH
jgi:hypothetical protein